MLDEVERPEPQSRSVATTYVLTGSEILAHNHYNMREVMRLGAQQCVDRMTEEGLLMRPDPRARYEVAVTITERYLP